MEINNKKYPFEIREIVRIPARTITNYDVKIKNNDKKVHDNYVLTFRNESSLTDYIFEFLMNK